MGGGRLRFPLAIMTVMFVPGSESHGSSSLTGRCALKAYWGLILHLFGPPVVCADTHRFLSLPKLLIQHASIGFRLRLYVMDTEAL